MVSPRGSEPRGSASSQFANELNEGAQMLPQSVPKSPQVLIQRTQRNFDFNENSNVNINPEPRHQNLVSEHESPDLDR